MNEKKCARARPANTQIWDFADCLAHQERAQERWSQKLISNLMELLVIS